MQSSRYAHARQMKRARACTRKLKTQLGRVVREIERQIQTIRETRQLLQTAHRIYAQQRHDKNKIYSVHEPEVQCIAKGKAGKHYEFGNKVSVAVSSRGGWFVGAKSFTGNPYDGHTLAAQRKQVEILIANQVAKRMSIWAIEATTMMVRSPCMSTRGEETYIGSTMAMDETPCRSQPSIGHLKNEHRLERNRLKGTAGNEINAIMAAAAMNFQ